jgi:hypothetical protein
MHQKLGQQCNGDQHGRDDPENRLCIYHRLLIRQVRKKPAADSVEGKGAQSPPDQHAGTRFGGAQKQYIGRWRQNSKGDHGNRSAIREIGK